MFTQAFVPFQIDRVNKIKFVYGGFDQVLKMPARVSSRIYKTAILQKKKKKKKKNRCADLLLCLIIRIVYVS